jgi:hypothetical protein
MTYFYFDFRDVDKQNRRDLLLSLITQLSDVTYTSQHKSGAQRHSKDELKDILVLLNQKICLHYR